MNQTQRNIIEKFNSKINLEAEAICQKMFNETVKPYCDRTGYEFISGMGTYGFFLQNQPKRIYDVVRIEEPEYISELLNYEIAEFNVFMFLNDYTPTLDKIPTP